MLDAGCLIALTFEGRVGILTGKMDILDSGDSIS